MSILTNNSLLYTGMFNLNAATDLIAQSLTRLSSGLRINTAADDPSGAIVSVLMDAQLAGLNAAVDNAQQAGHTVNTAAEAAAGVSASLQEIRTLVLEIANSGALTAAEIEAKQTSIDEAVAAINTLVAATSFNGKQLIDGSGAITTSGVDTSQLDEVTVYSTRLGDTPSLPIDINVITSGQLAEVTHSGASIASSVTLQIQGTLGTTTLTFASGAAASAIVAGVNNDTTDTGVSATLSGADGIRFGSTTYGSSAFVSVSVVSGTFNLDSDDGSGTDYGRDAVAIVNGRSVQGQGLKLSYVTPRLTFSATLDESFGAGQADAFHVIGGGLTFQLTGDAVAGVTLGIPNLHAATIGGPTGKVSQVVSGGTYSATDNANTALAIVDEALQQVALLEGRLGGFSTYTLEPTASVLQDSLTQLTAARDAIVNTDFALETANLARGQVLAQTSLALLQIANQQSASLLLLLNGLT